MRLFDADASRPFKITTWQLATAIHGYYTCPYNHKPTAKKYVPVERCARLVRLVAESRSVLERASAQPLVPGLRGETYVGEEDQSRPTLPPGYEQTSVLEMLGVRSAA